MRYSIAIAVAGLAVSVFSQGLADLPPCATQCLLSGLAGTGCEITDFKCACSDEKFVAGSTTCIRGSCGPADQEKALAVSKALCKKAGVDITPPGVPASTATPKPVPDSSKPVSSAAPTPTATIPATSVASVPIHTSAGSIATSAVPTLHSPTVPISGNQTVNSTYTKPPMETQTGNSAARVGGLSALSLLGLGVMGALAF